MDTKEKTKKCCRGKCKTKAAEEKPSSEKVELSDDAVEAAAGGRSILVASGGGALEKCPKCGIELRFGRCSICGYEALGDFNNNLI